MFDIPAKWRAFGWNVKEIDGHDMNEVVEGMNFLSQTNDGPSILIAHTVKGKGVSFMEDNPAFHGAAPNDEQYAQALTELGVSV
jgi:transketolase